MNKLRPAVCLGPWQGKVKKSQTGDGGLHAVGQSPGAAVPREPGAQMAEELQKEKKKVYSVIFSHETEVRRRDSFLSE